MRLTKLVSTIAIFTIVLFCFSSKNVNAVYFTKDLVSKVDLKTGYGIAVCPVDTSIVARELLTTNVLSLKIDEVFQNITATGCKGPEQNLLIAEMNYTLRNSTSSKKLSDELFLLNDILYRTASPVIEWYDDSNQDSGEESQLTLKNARYVANKKLYEVNINFENGGEKLVSDSGFINFFPKATQSAEFLPKYPSFTPFAKDEFEKFCKDFQKPGDPVCGGNLELSQTTDDITTVQNWYIDNFKKIGWTCSLTESPIESATGSVEASNSAKFTTINILSCHKQFDNFNLVLYAQPEGTKAISEIARDSIHSLFIVNGQAYKILRVNSIVHDIPLADYSNLDFPPPPLDPAVSNDVGGFPIFENSVYVTKEDNQQCLNSLDAENTCPNYILQANSSFDTVDKWYRDNLRGWGCGDFTKNPDMVDNFTCIKDTKIYNLQLLTEQGIVTIITINVPPPPKTRVNLVFDISSLVGKNQDEVLAILGEPESKTGTSYPTLLYKKDNVTLEAVFNKDKSFYNIGVLFPPEDPIKDQSQLIKLFNLTLDAKSYRVALFYDDNKNITDFTVYAK